MLLEAIARRFPQLAALSEATVGLRATPLLSLGIAQVEGEGDEATRAGLRFHMSATGATGQAPVQALPTTTAGWLLYNPLSSRKTIFLDALGMVVISGTAGSGMVVLAAMVGPANVPTTTPAAAAGVVLSNANAGSKNTSALVVASAQTLVGTTGFWSPIAVGLAKDGVVTVPPVLMGIAEQRDIRGKIALPPGSGLGLAVVAPTGTTPLYAPYASYREYVTDNE